MKLPVILISVCMLLGCSSADREKSGFDLHADLYDFNTRLEEGDTLRIDADLSGCMSRCYESNILYRKNGVLFLASSRRGEFVDKQDEESGPAVLRRCEVDSLNIQEFLKSMHADRLDPEEYSTRFTVSFKEDTIQYCSHGIVDGLRKVRYYLEVKRCLFPDEESYRTASVPADKELEWGAIGKGR